MVNQLYGVHILPYHTIVIKSLRGGDTHTQTHIPMLQPKQYHKKPSMMPKLLWVILISSYWLIGVCIVNVHTYIASDVKQDGVKKLCWCMNYLCNACYNLIIKWVTIWVKPYLAANCLYSRDEYESLLSDTTSWSTHA